MEAEYLPLALQDAECPHAGAPAQEPSAGQGGCSSIRVTARDAGTGQASISPNHVPVEVLQRVRVFCGAPGSEAPGVRAAALTPVSRADFCLYARAVYAAQADRNAVARLSLEQLTALLLVADFLQDDSLLDWACYDLAGRMLAADRRCERHALLCTLAAAAAAVVYRRRRVHRGGHHHRAPPPRLRLPPLPHRFLVLTASCAVTEPQTWRAVWRSIAWVWRRTWAPCGSAFRRLRRGKTAFDEPLPRAALQSALTPFHLIWRCMLCASPPELAAQLTCDPSQQRLIQVMAELPPPIQMRICAALRSAPLTCVLRVLPRQLHGHAIAARTCAPSEGALPVLTLTLQRTTGHAAFYRSLADAPAPSPLADRDGALHLRLMHRSCLAEDARQALYLPMLSVTKAAAFTCLAQGITRAPEVLRSAIGGVGGKLIYLQAPRALCSYETESLHEAARRAARQLEKGPAHALRRVVHAISTPQPRRRVANRHLWLQVLIHTRNTRSRWLRSTCALAHLTALEAPPTRARIHPDAAAALFTAAASGELSSIDFRGISLPKHPLLLHAVLCSPRLTTLDLRGCSLNVRAWMRLRGGLQGMAQLAQLELDGTTCSARPFHELAVTLAHYNTALHTLSMPECYQTLPGAAAASALTAAWRSLAALPALRRLAVQVDVIEGTPAAWAVRGLEDTSPAMPGLRRAALRAVSVRAAAEAVRRVPNVRALTLEAVPADSGLGTVAGLYVRGLGDVQADEAWASLCDALAQLQHLEDVALGAPLLEPPRQQLHLWHALSVAAPAGRRLQLGGDLTPDLSQTKRSSLCEVAVGFDVQLHAGVGADWREALGGVTSLALHAPQCGQVALHDSAALGKHKLNARQGFPTSLVAAERWRAQAPNPLGVPLATLTGLQRLQCGLEGLWRLERAELEGLQWLEVLDMARCPLLQRADCHTWRRLEPAAALLRHWPRLRTWDLSGNAVSDIIARRLLRTPLAPGSTGVVVALRDTAVTPREVFELRRRQAQRVAASNGVAEPCVVFEF